VTLLFPGIFIYNPFGNECDSRINWKRWTNKFIFPPYEFNIADSMITNLHLPKSSLLIMVAAFGGTELIMDAYQEALKEKYRFFSYGDAMLIL